jgi:hypothetical protein
MTFGTTLVRLVFPYILWYARSLNT